MKLFELKYPSEIKNLYSNNITTFLGRHGFRKLGSGLNATVFEHPKLDYVLKIFSGVDHCYKSFIKLVNSNPSIYFPKFRGKMMKLTYEYYAIRMEKLTDIEDNIKVIANSMIDISILKDRLDSYVYRYTQSIDNETTAIFNHFPGLQDACDLCKTYKPKTCFFDLHRNNIMFRGNIPVIIDPWGV